MILLVAAASGRDVPQRIAHGHVLKDYLAVQVTRLGGDGPAIAGTADIDFAGDVAMVIPRNHFLYS